jgi:hypothetical protein
LKERGQVLSPTAIREVLKAEGFAALPRRLDEERPGRPRPLIEAVASPYATRRTTDPLTEKGACPVGELNPCFRP